MHLNLPLLVQMSLIVGWILADEDWELQHGRLEGTSSHRNSRKRHREGSPLSDDSSSSFDYEPGKRRARGSSRDVPETMAPRKTKGTVSCTA